MMLFIRFSKRHLVWIWQAGMLVGLTMISFQPLTRYFAMGYVKETSLVHWVTMLTAPLMIVFALFLGWQIHLRWPRLDWAPLGLETGITMSLSTNKRLLVWAPCTALMLWNMPILAFYEEVIFRNWGSRTILGAILIGGVLFGAVHFTGLVAIRETVIASIGGLILFGAFRIGGLGASWDLHTSFNLQVMLFILVMQKVRWVNVRQPEWTKY
jgi:hypothetical protein